MTSPLIPDDREFICLYCKTSIYVGDGQKILFETTMDAFPPAKAVGWVFLDDDSVPDFSQPPTHMCERGVRRRLFTEAGLAGEGKRSLREVFSLDEGETS